MKVCRVGKRLENVEDGVCEGGITECCYDYEDWGVYGECMQGWTKDQLYSLTIYPKKIKPYNSLSTSIQKK